MQPDVILHIRASDGIWQFHSVLTVFCFLQSFEGSVNEVVCLVYTQDLVCYGFICMSHCKDCPFGSFKLCGVESSLLLTLDLTSDMLSMPTATKPTAGVHVVAPHHIGK